MIKKIRADQLKPGIYVHDLNCGWMDHPFMRNRFKVESEAQVHAILKHGIREVYIDTRKGDDIKDAIPEEEAKAEIEKELVELATAEVQPETATSFNEEIARAKKVHLEANQIIQNILKDARLGKQVEIEQVEPMVEKITGTILRNNSALISLCKIKTKDTYTFQHSVSVCALLVSFSRAMNLDQETIRQAGIGGLLHDIGKMRVRDEVLNKPGKLTDPEFTHMKTHVEHSHEILSATPGLSRISIDVAAQHHERHDGTGYPHGLKGGEISLFGQMAAIVDVYDAITSDRVYHKGMQATDALRKIFEWSKFHFNHQLAQSFTRAIGIYPSGTLVRLESGLLGVVVEQRESSLLQPLVRVVYDTKRDFHIEPKDIDLSRPFGQGGGDRILGHESGERWRIDPQKYL
jgi:putative nucleotidyltransferase with HDIG domain